MKTLTCLTTLLATALCLTSGVASAASSTINVINWAAAQRVKVNLPSAPSVNGGQCYILNGIALPKVIDAGKNLPQGTTTVATYDPSIALSYTCSSSYRPTGWKQSVSNTIASIEMCTLNATGTGPCNFTNLTSWHASDKGKNYAACLDQMNATGGTMSISVLYDAYKKYNYIEVDC